ncbi:MAG: hypothetical protein WBA57_13615 [Elainellaceae cyanobacterium]
MSQCKERSPTGRSLFLQAEHYLYASPADEFSQCITSPLWF